MSRMDKKDKMQKEAELEAREEALEVFGRWLRRCCL